MSRNDQSSGWDSDEKSQPMMVVAPSGGAGRMTIGLLVAALVIALGIAAYSLLQLNSQTRAHAEEVKKLTEKHTGEVKVMEERLTRANAYRREDLDYIQSLETDNAALAALKPGQKAGPAPIPPERQKYIDDLESENSSRRNRKPTKPTAPPPGYDAWKNL